VNEFIVFSDPHYHVNQNKSYTNSKGISSWLQTQIDLTHDIFNYAKENNVETIICNGDIFEEKNRINSGIYNIVWDLFRYYSKQYNIIFNTGNHDIYKKNHDSSLLPFSDIVTVITTPTIIDNIKIIPYGMTEGELKSDADILFLHEEIEGIVNFDSNKLIELQDLSKYRIVFNGHIHTPCSIHNVINIGSMCPQNWGEAKDQKRFIHFKNNTPKSIPLNHPKWNILSDIPNEISDFEFYRIDISTDELINPIFKLYNVFPNVVKMRNKKTRLKQIGNTKDEVLQYINLMNTEHLDYDKLFNIGMELLR